jgi:hypothetical protein
LARHERAKTDVNYKSKYAVGRGRLNKEFAEKPFFDKTKKFLEKQIEVYNSVENISEKDKFRLEVYKETLSNLPKVYSEDTTTFEVVKTLISKDFDIKKNQLLE